MRLSPFWGYTLARLGLLFAVGAALWLLGLRSWALAFAALLLSLPLSLVALRKQRTALAHDLELRVRRRRDFRARLRGDGPAQ